MDWFELDAPVTPGDENSSNWFVYPDITNGYFFTGYDQWGNQINLNSNEVTPEDKEFIEYLIGVANQALGVQTDYNQSQNQQSQPKKQIKEKTKKTGKGLVVLLCLIIVALGGALGYTYLQLENFKRNNISQVKEYDDNGNIIIGYTQEMKPIISRDENGNETLGEAQLGNNNLPLITVRTYNDKNEIIKEERIEKASEGIIKTPEQIEEEKKKIEEQKKAEERRLEEEKQKAHREEFYKPKGILKLPKEFFQKEKGSSEVQETPYRDLDIKIPSEGEHPFVVYNYDGTLNPYKIDTYKNRTVINKLMNYDLFKAVGLSLEVGIPEQTGAPVPYIKINMSDDTLRFEKLAEASVDKTIKLNVYRDVLEDNKSEYVAYLQQTMINALGTQDALNHNIVWDNYIVNDNKPETKAFTETVEELKVDIKKARESTLTPDILAKHLQGLYDKLYDIKLAELQKTACAELNTFKPNLCKEPKLISTLEIRSDYIEQAVKDTLEETIKYYPRALGIAYYYAVGPASKK